MEDDNLVRIDVICSHYEIEHTFVDALLDYGLIEVTVVEDNKFLDKSRISDLERWIHLHYDLDINFEGIDTIANLLERMNALQNELTEMKNKLLLYEVSGEWL